MKHLITIILLVIAIPTIGFSQGIIDAYRLSSHQINGTARAASMGNAFGSLGGDFTSLSINPAGIAVYRSNELVFTPTLNISSSEMNLVGSKFSDNNTKFKLNNIGFVGTYSSKNQGSGIVSFNFGIGYNNIMDYDNDFFVENNQSPISFLDGIVNWASSEALSWDYLGSNYNNVEFRDWPAKLAWETYLMDPFVDDHNNEVEGEYISILYDDEKVDQVKVYEQSGGINEFVLSGGLNINHQLYLGASVGIHDVNINQLTAYTEYLEDDNSFTYYDDLYIEGEGYNFKLGAIFKPTNSLRLGLAYHTPTYYMLTEENILAMNSRLYEEYYDEARNIYDYDFRTPSKVIMSGSFVFGKKAILSVDGEYQDYSNMKFKNGGVNESDDFSDVNSKIEGSYKSVFNVKVGGEYKLTPQVSLRAGYETYANPFDVSQTEEFTMLNDDSSILSFGLGYTTGKFFTDIAYTQANSSYLVYNIQPNIEKVELENTKSKILLTIGFKF